MPEENHCNGCCLKSEMNYEIIARMKCADNCLSKKEDSNEDLQYSNTSKNSSIVLWSKQNPNWNSLHYHASQVNAKIDPFQSTVPIMEAYAVIQCPGATVGNELYIPRWPVALYRGNKSMQPLTKRARSEWLMKITEEILDVEAEFAKLCKTIPSEVAEHFYGETIVELPVLLRSLLQATRQKYTIEHKLELFMEAVKNAERRMQACQGTDCTELQSIFLAIKSQVSEVHSIVVNVYHTLSAVDDTLEWIFEDDLRDRDPTFVMVKLTIDAITTIRASVHDVRQILMPSAYCITEEINEMLRYFYATIESSLSLKEREKETRAGEYTATERDYRNLMWLLKELSYEQMIAITDTLQLFHYEQVGERLMTHHLTLSFGDLPVLEHVGRHLKHRQSEYTVLFDVLQSQRRTIAMLGATASYTRAQACAGNDEYLVNTTTSCFEPVYMQTEKLVQLMELNRKSLQLNHAHVLSLRQQVAVALQHEEDTLSTS